MNCIIPYSKEIVFDSKIKEITSISLEHEMTINDDEILGNFIVSGEYKAHELSINKEDFLYTLPFSIDINELVIKESIKFEIIDFSYEILNDNTLKVMIEFKITADEEEREELKEDVFIPVEEPIIEEEIIERKNEYPNNIESEEKNIVNKTISKAVDSYKTYHIHIVKEEETLESICLKYNSSTDVIKEYNDISNIIPGDKLIIPEDD